MNNYYEVFLIDGIDYIKLDTERIDLTTTFSVSDIADISKKQDTLTKEVIFKGTKTNNYAFGSWFHLNKHVDESEDRKLFLNFNPLQSVDCIVYENRLPILEGSLRLIEIVVNDIGDVYYSTIITGKVTEFRTLIAEATLTDLDFSDLQHRFNITNITNSWANGIETYDTTTNSFSNKPFQMGQGYVYPFIDYGHLFHDNALLNGDISKHHVLNCRPAIYAKEYLDRMFTAQGFTYEIKGDDAFKAKFNSLIVPFADEKMTYKLSGLYQKFAKSLVQIVNNSGMTLKDNSFTQGKLIPIPITTNVTAPGATFTISPYIFLTSFSNNIIQFDRTVTTDGYCSVQFQNISNPLDAETYINVEVVKRTYATTTDTWDGWESVGHLEFVVPRRISQSTPSTIPAKNITFTLGEATYDETTQVALRVTASAPPFVEADIVQWQISTAELRFPKDDSTQITADVKIGTSAYDIITPKAPENIKQIDWLKGLLTEMNLYIYPSADNPKNLVFEKYDDYYASTLPDIITSTALNWTNKIDFTKGWKYKLNSSIPKSYLFTYKEDNDMLNQLYKKKYGEVFGTLRFSDSLGVGEQKKVESVFSATPMYANGTARLFPALYSLESNAKKLAKTNIRLLYYNGVNTCQEYTIEKDLFSTTWTSEQLYKGTSYAQASTYYYENGEPTEDLNFARPNELYFPVSPAYANAKSIYSAYYINQVSELTNKNVTYLYANAYLNELDVHNLNLKIPVYIDTGENGNAYFKVLSVEYTNADTPASVILQRIVF